MTDPTSPTAARLAEIREHMIDCEICLCRIGRSGEAFMLDLIAKLESAREEIAHLKAIICDNHVKNGVLEQSLAQADARVAKLEAALREISEMDGGTNNLWQATDVAEEAMQL